MHHIDNVNFKILDDRDLKEDWVSEVIDADEPFKNLIVSWNCNTSENSALEVWVRVYTNQGWSMWFSYGKWATNGNNKGSFNNQKDSIANLNVDEVSLLSGLGEAFQVKAELSRKSVTTVSPILRAIHISTSSGDLCLKIPSTFNEKKLIQVPRRAQLPYENIGRVICSPTSVAMVLDHYGIDIPTLKVAQGAKDNGTSIYGNWAYNVAYASEQNLRSYVKYCKDFGDILENLDQDVPIVASILIKDKDELKGSIQAYPSGHLLVVTGYEVIDEIPYVHVNDPASNDDESVARKYRIEEFLNAWKNVIYVIEPPS